MMLVVSGTDYMVTTTWACSCFSIPPKTGRSRHLPVHPEPAAPERHARSELPAAGP